MNDLERRLQELGREVVYPATPQFELSDQRRPARLIRLRPAALAFAIVCALVAGVLAFSPGARSAFLEIFRIRGATVERIETLPKLQLQRVDFGERVTPDEATRRFGLRPLGLDREPDAIYLRPDGLASAVYGDPAEPRLVLSQARGALFDGFIKKTGSGSTTIQSVTVDGEPGLFVDGADHFIMFLDENGEISDEQTYLAGTVLLWNRGPLLMRLEGDLTLDEAVEIAESVE
jgi:hypothetical protein